MNNLPGEQSVLLGDAFLSFSCTACTLPFALKNGVEFGVLASSSVYKLKFLLLFWANHVVLLGPYHICKMTGMD